MSALPPPVISSAKLLVYAHADSGVKFTDRIHLYVGDGERLGRMPGLAICENYCAPADVLLLFCDEEWDAKGAIPFTTVEEAKIKAERGYTGITAKWVPSPYSESEVMDFLRDVYDVDPRSEWWKTICSFCGKDVSSGQFCTAPQATICAKCIDLCYEMIREE